MPSDSFRFDAKNVFLTYPQSGLLTAERLRDFLVEELGAKWFHIGRESHDDGQPHLHAYAGWDQRHRARGADHFDVDGKHPNITIPRSVRDVRKYVGKDGNVLTNCDGPEFDRDDEQLDKWKELLASTSRQEFMGKARELCGREYILQLDRLEYFCEKHYGRESTGYCGRTRGAFREPDALTRWVEENWEVLVRGGPSPLPTMACAYPLMPIGVETENGKTTLALAGGSI